MKKKNDNEEDTMRPEYDFDYSKGVRGKYYQRILEEGSTIVILKPKVEKTTSKLSLKTRKVPAKPKSAVK